MGINSSGELPIVSDSEYLERINSLKNAGLVIDTAGKLYKVNSRGVMNNAVYNLIAYIDLPIKPQPNKPKPAGQTPQSTDGEQSAGQTPGTQQTGVGGTPSTGQKEKPTPIELLLPRVVEIRLE